MNNEINEDDYRRILKEELKIFKKIVQSKEKPVVANIGKLNNTEKNLKTMIHKEVESTVKKSLENLLLNSEEFQKNNQEQKGTENLNSEIRFLKDESVFTHVIKFTQFLIKTIFNKNEEEDKYLNDNDTGTDDPEKQIRIEKEKRLKKIEEHLRKINLYKKNKNYASRSAYYVMYEIDKETEKEHLFYQMYTALLEKVKKERVFKILSSVLKILLTFTILLSAIFIFIDRYMGRELRIKEAIVEKNRLQEENKVIENKTKFNESKIEKINREKELEELKQENKELIEKIQEENYRLKKEITRFSEEIDTLQEKNNRLELPQNAKKENPPPQ